MGLDKNALSKVKTKKLPGNPGTSNLTAFIMDNPTQLSMAFEAADDGKTREQCEIADFLWQKNLDIRALLVVRQGAVRASNWEIRPADSSPEAKVIMEDTLKMLNGIKPHRKKGLCSLRGLIGGLALQAYTGFKIFEKVWDDHGFKIIGFKRIREKHIEFVEGEPRLIIPGQKKPVELPEEQFIVHADECEDMTSNGLIRPLSKLNYLSETPLWMYARYVEKFGDPLIKALVDANSLEELKPILEELLEEFSGDKWGIFPTEANVEYEETEGKGAEIYDKFLSLVMKKASMLIIGSDSILSASDVSGKSTREQNHVRRDILLNDLALIEDTINSQVINQYVCFAHGEEKQHLAPMFQFKTKHSRDLKSVVDSVTKLEENGIRVDLTQIEAETGWRLERTGVKQDGDD